MKLDPLPPNETQRLAALRMYGVLDTPPEAAPYGQRPSVEFASLGVK